MLHINVFNEQLSGENIDIIPEMLFDTTLYQSVLYISVEDNEYYFLPGIGLIRFVIPNQQGNLTEYTLENFFIQ